MADTVETSQVHARRTDRADFWQTRCNIPCDYDLFAILFAIFLVKIVFQSLNCLVQEAQQAVNAVIAQVYSNDTQVIENILLS